MKNCIACVIAFVILTAFSMAHGASVTFEWDPNPPEQKVSNYRIHIGTASRQYTRTEDAGTATRLKVQNLVDGRYFAAATAHDAAGNSSDLSEEIQFEVDTTAPSGVMHFRFMAVGRE